MRSAPNSAPPFSKNAMRNGARKTITSANNTNTDQRKKNGATILRGFFVSLILIAVGLTALAMQLTYQLWSKKPAGDHFTNHNKDGEVVVGYAAAHKKQSKQRKTGVVSKAATLAAAKAEAAALSEAQKRGHTYNNNIDKNDNNARQATTALSSQQPYPNGPKTDAKYAHDRVYCMVPFIWNKDSYDVIMKTWGRRCNVINFLTDAMVLDGGKIQGDMISEDPTKGYKHHTEFPEGTFPDNVHFIEMTRPWTGCKDLKTKQPKICRHIWEKMWQSWTYVGERHLDQADWFCKVDYDTFFFPENLQYYVRDQKDWDPYNEHHYFGGVLSHRSPAPDLAAGACACWSHKTMKGITEVYKNMPKGHQGGDRGRCEDRPQASEEISTAMCLKKGLNVTVEPMRDEKMREYVMVDPYRNHLTWNRTDQGEWWFWKGKPKNVGQLEDCCARRPMAIHKYKRKEQIEQLEQHFYGPNDNKELKKLNEVTRRYADRVRDAMGIFSAQT